MAKVQPSKFNTKPVVQITTIWTLCFLIGPLAGWAIGEALKNTPLAIPENGTLMYIPLGLIIAQTMSGFFTALILRKRLSGLKPHHIILIAVGWGITALISSYAMAMPILSPD
jgi:hypothetical protein